MDKDEVVIEWLKALRSGEYKQAYGALRTQEEDGSYCHCVAGVLANVIDPNAWRGTGDRWYHEQDGEMLELEEDKYPQVYWKGDAFGLRSVVNLEEYGIDPQVLNTAMRMNDDEYSSFESIANYLEDALSTGSVSG